VTPKKQPQRRYSIRVFGWCAGVTADNGATTSVRVGEKADRFEATTTLSYDD